MRLVDAVDAMADNRGELLFELRGATQRQFALYRVLRGEATRIFVTGGDAIGTPSWRMKGVINLSFKRQSLARRLVFAPVAPIQ